MPSLNPRCNTKMNRSRVYGVLRARPFSYARNRASPMVWRVRRHTYTRIQYIYIYIYIYREREREYTRIFFDLYDNIIDIDIDIDIVYIYSK